MEETLILVQEYCSVYQIETDFVHHLEKEGLITLTVTANDYYLDEEQLHLLEQYRRWHYDLQINIEGIEVVSHLLNKINYMQEEMEALRNRLKLYE